MRAYLPLVGLNILRGKIISQEFTVTEELSPLRAPLPRIVFDDEVAELDNLKKYLNTKTISDASFEARRDPGTRESIMKLILGTVLCCWLGVSEASPRRPSSFEWEDVNFL